MTYLRLPYDDASSPKQMATDCQAVSLALQPPPAAPEVPTPTRAISLSVSDAAATLAETFLD